MRRLHATATAEDEPLASINIIPFVDIVLVLLVVFMLTSVAIVRATMKVDLPKAASAGATVESTVNLVMTKDGVFLLNGQPTTPDAAGAFIKAEVAKHPKLQAVIAADKAVAYGQVMAVVDMVKKNGVTSFALDVERSLAPAPIETTPPPATPAPTP
jgi:biopolymer transport protein ExbD